MRELYFIVLFQPGPLPSRWCGWFWRAAFDPVAARLWVFLGFQFSVHVSPLSIWPIRGAPTAFLLLLIATDLRGQEIKKWVLAAISRFREGVAARLREQKQRWKQREPSEVPFMTADSFIGTCRRATLLIIHTLTHTHAICGHVE